MKHDPNGGPPGIEQLAAAGHLPGSAAETRSLRQMPLNHRQRHRGQVAGGQLRLPLRMRSVHEPAHRGHKGEPHRVPQKHSTSVCPRRCHARRVYPSVEKAIHGLCPLKRRPKKPRLFGVAGRRIPRRQTCSTVC